MRPLLVTSIFGSALAITVGACAPPIPTALREREATAPADREDSLDEEDEASNGDGASPNGSTKDDEDERPNGPCAGETKQASCTQCCDGANQAALRALERLRERCFCASPGQCADVCGDTLCSGRVTEPRSACGDCIVANMAACTEAAALTCRDDASCSPLVSCYATSGCKAKPS